MTSPYPPWHPRLESMAEFVKRANLSDAGLVLNRCQLTHGPLGRCADCPPQCDCPLDPHHRWNCPLTPIWAQTIRALDCNPWTVIRPCDELPTVRIRSPRCDICSCCHPWYPCRPDCHICWGQP